MLCVFYASPGRPCMCVCVCDYFFFFKSSCYLKCQDKCKARMILIIACEREAQQKLALK